MPQKTRLDDILNILKKQGYVTVKYLMEELHYSSATINRDLNLLEKQELVTRSYGGVELTKHQGTPLVFRYHKMRVAKNRIGREAAQFIRDGDTIFIDGSTTGQYIGQYITERKDLTVITNNMALVTFLSEYGIHCICLGGQVAEPPSMLGGEETARSAGTYLADKMFFSTGGITADGRILDGPLYYLMHLTMAGNAKEIYYLADHEKLDRRHPDNRVLFDCGKVNVVITDNEFAQDVKERYPATRFIRVKE